MHKFAASDTQGKEKKYQTSPCRFNRKRADPLQNGGLFASTRLFYQDWIYVRQSREKN